MVFRILNLKLLAIIIKMHFLFNLNMQKISKILKYKNF